MKYLSALFLMFIVALPPAFAIFEDEDEPLMPKEAFKLKAYATSPDSIRAEWIVAEGYYLYKEKFKFSTESKGITLGEPVYPKGKIKEDEFFGKVESYRKKVSVDIPITRTADASEELVLDTVSQGCADIGVCYPPQKESISFVLIPADDTSVSSPIAKASNASSGLQLLGQLNKNQSVLNQEGEFLPVDQAFAFTAEVIDENTIVAQWDVAEGYFLYREKFEFSLIEGEGVSLLAPQYPKGKPKNDALFGEVEVYEKEAIIKIPLSRAGTKPVDITLRAKYQGCADAGFCYPPEVRTMAMTLPATASNAKLMSSSTESASPAPVMLSEQDSIANALSDSNIFMVILTFFGFGLLLAFTPCVFPMVPILSSIIVGQGDDVTTRKAFTMSLVYVLAMALTYTVAGVIAGLFGANLQAAFQTPWILISFSIVFLLLSLSMFGFYDLQMPASWQSKLSEISNSQKGGTLAGVAIMGFLSALIVGPCVAAPLMGALIYIGQTGDAVLGGLALFALSMGMGAPLIAIGSSAGKLLPKAGAWMDAVKAVFGVMLIAVAIWMLERVVPPAIAMFFWAILLIVSGIYMGALTNLESSVSGWRKLWKGVGLVIVIYGGLMLIGVASNGSDPLQPLRGLSLGGGASGVAAPQHVEFKKIKTVDDLDREIQLATAQNKPVMLDFYADWCISCKEMERYTFSDAKVMAEMSKGVLLQADVTANDEQDKALLKRFKLIGPPSIIFWTREGKELPHMRMVGFLEAGKFAAHVEKAFK